MIDDPEADGGPWTDAIDVLGLLPHRYPLLLVDRIRVVEPGRRALGLKRVTGAEWLGAVSQHAGEMPAMLMVEALAQTSAGVLVGLLDGTDGAVGYFASANRVRLRARPRPGDTLLLAVELRAFRRGIARLAGLATVEGRLAVSAELTTVVRGRVA